MSRAHRSGPTYLFHGTSQPIVGNKLLPAPPFGDVGDPAFPVVFASDLLEFATLFSAKSRATTHISVGSFVPYLILRDAHPESRDVEGKVFVVENCGFSQAVVDGKPTGKWWTPAAVPVEPEKAIAITGRQHLMRMGAVIVHVQADADKERSWADEVHAALQSASSAESCWAVLDRFVDSGVINYESAPKAATSSLALFRQPQKARPTLSDQLDTFLDDVAGPKLPLQARVRVIHGADHACRTAILCRVLHNLLVKHRLMREFAPEELAALMATAFFHDADREFDIGPDTSTAHSAVFAHDALRALGFSMEQASTARHRIANEHMIDGNHDLGAAILQTADAFELMRCYVGEIRLPYTRLFRLLDGRCPPALADLVRVAQMHAVWLRRLKSFGLSEGRVVGRNNETAVLSEGFELDPISIARRNLSETPFRRLRATLGEVEELDLWYQGRI